MGLQIYGKADPKAELQRLTKSIKNSYSHTLEKCLLNTLYWKFIKKLCFSNGSTTFQLSWQTRRHRFRILWPPASNTYKVFPYTDKQLDTPTGTCTFLKWFSSGVWCLGQGLAGELHKWTFETVDGLSDPLTAAAVAAAPVHMLSSFSSICVGENLLLLG